MTSRISRGKYFKNNDPPPFSMHTGKHTEICLTTNRVFHHKSY